MAWAPKRHDLNIINCVGLDEETEVYERNPKSTEALWLVLEDVWNNLPAQFLQNVCKGTY